MKYHFVAGWKGNSKVQASYFSNYGLICIKLTKDTKKLAFTKFDTKSMISIKEILKNNSFVLYFTVTSLILFRLLLAKYHC
jgi:hypothetical protein